MKEYIDWQDIDIAVDKMVDYYKERKFNCDAIVGIPRGGLTLAAMLSYRLDIPLHLAKDYRLVLNDKLFSPPKVKQFLIVDDIADTGETLKNNSTSDDVIFTIHYHRKSIIKPDFYMWKKEDKWIVYPWEEKDSEEIQDYLKQEDTNE